MTDKSAAAVREIVGVRAKIIISSKELADQLQHIDFEGGEYVEFADLVNEVLTITTSHQHIRLLVNTTQINPVLFKQGDTRWDWAYDTLKNIPEQPIVLELRDNSVSITITF